jgi:hypothetical protein
MAGTGGFYLFTGKYMKQYKRFAKKLRGLAEVLTVLADEVETDKKVSPESADLCKKVGSRLLFSGCCAWVFNSVDKAK